MAAALLEAAQQACVEIASAFATPDEAEEGRVIERVCAHARAALGCVQVQIVLSAPAAHVEYKPRATERSERCSVPCGAHGALTALYQAGGMPPREVVVPALVCIADQAAVELEHVSERRRCGGVARCVHAGASGARRGDCGGDVTARVRAERRESGASTWHGSASTWRGRDGRPEPRRTRSSRGGGAESNAGSTEADAPAL